MTQLVVSKTFLPLPRRRPTSFRRDRRVCPPVMPKDGVSPGPERLLAACPERSEISGASGVSGATVRSGRTRQLNSVHYPQPLHPGVGCLACPITLDATSQTRLAVAEAGQRTPV